MNNIDFANKAKLIANNYKTLYIMGCFGSPMTPTNKKRFTSNYPYNAQPERKAMIEAASADTFGFDCVCLIKGILWGWNGDKSAVYGGAKYNFNGVPDFGTEEMLNYCTGISSDFSKLEVGEVLWMKGHVGIVVDAEKGIAVEASPKWKNGVQYSSINRTVSGYNRRDWTKHGKIKFVEYKKVVPKQKDTSITLPVVEQGSVCYAVKTLQRLLDSLGYRDQYNKVLSIDGHFGAKTAYAVKDFQKDKKITVDGQVGKETWSVLLNGN